MTEHFTLRDYDETVAAIRSRTSHTPTIGLILGSGLNDLADTAEDTAIIPYAELPHFPATTVAGHAGRLVIGRLAGVVVCIMQGRFHSYEGYSLQQTTFPVRVMQRLGVRTLVLTNAAGGVHPDLAVGDLMVIEDHINLPGMAGNNPLRGPNLDEFGPRFPAANRVYTRRLRDLALQRGVALGLPMRRGVYCMLAGPNFESPAEIRMLRGWGADAVGMSTVPEALVAHHAGMDVLAVSTITNVCIDALESQDEPSHEEVNAAGKLIVPRLRALLLDLLPRLV